MSKTTNTGAAQMMMFGAKSGVEKVRPVSHGDVIVTHSGARHIVTKVDDNIHGEVYLTIKIDTGSEAIVLAREVAYRSN